LKEAKHAVFVSCSI